ncbi:WxL domain-containing protein [Enterococcus mundtii]|uniref:WxL domain-containing protein n=1 Tax=Enterococcus mundtii TaxID=53346 RepID=UPI0020C1517E|nr:WxL domain-containing protein [Enterococcus mundtii]
MIIFRRQLAVCITFLLILHTIPLYFIQTHAVTNDQFDEPSLASSRENSLSYLALNNPVVPMETSTEDIQEFSFVEKTFRSSVGQAVILRFTSTLEAEEVLVRIPANGQIIEDLFTNGELISHSHGEYWIFKTKQKQTTFELPVIFDKPGNYFLTIDHDADHFYLEVEESSSESGIIESEDLKEPDLTEQEESDVKDQKHKNKELEAMNESPIAIQPVMAIEKNLSIPEEVVAAEEARILEEITDSQNRTTTSVSNWSQFRSAWNSSNQFVLINMSSNITFSSSILGSSLNKLNNLNRSIGSLNTNNYWINMGTSDNSLQLGNGELTIRYATITSENSGSQPLVAIDSSSAIIFSEESRIINRRNSPALLVDDRSEAQVGMLGRKLIYNHATVSPVQLRRNSKLDFRGGSAGGGAPGVIGSNGASSSWIPPISSDASSSISFSNSTGNVMMGGHINVGAIGPYPSAQHLTSYRVSWNSVTAELTGVNGSIITSSNSDPNDFSERYLANYSLPAYRSITVGASASDGFNPPRSSYELSLQATPTEGGSPTAESTTITQGETTQISAIPNPKFDFLRWEIVSGTESSITDETNGVTTFTMGTSDVTIRAVYQKKQGGDVTVKYLDESLVQLAEPQIIKGFLDEEYETEPIEIEGYTLQGIPDNAKGRFITEEQIVTYLYTQDVLDPVPPVDPLDPEKEVDPENPPTLPEEQGLLSIDFASQFNFGSQAISVHNQTYYAQPQRLLNEDGTVNKSEERPNYVQISDRRPENDRNGWQLAVTQNDPFTATNNRELNGARLRLTNQQLATAQGGSAPEFQQTNPLALVPGNRRILLMAQGTEGTGTWIYRFGNQETANESVALDVPKGANPEANRYETTLTWELSAVPDN